MQVFLEIMQYLWVPLLGAVIGYFTNFIAVKMLFHPYKPWYIGKLRLPFTPGIVPRRQPILAKAIGDAVGNHLFTGDDLKDLFLSDETRERAVDMVMDALDLSLVFDETAENLPTADQLGLTYLKEDQWNTAKDGLVRFLTDRIVDAAGQMNLGQVIADQAASLLLEKKGGLGMLAMFINEHTIQGLLPSFAEKINGYIAENGEAMIGDAVRAQVEGYSARPLHDLMVYTSEEQIRAVVGAIYEKLLTGIGGRFNEMLDISAAVEKKVAAMSVKEVEDLCMKVMKRELNAIINLGALIGFVLGLLDLLFL